MLVHSHRLVLSHSLCLTHISAACSDDFRCAHIRRSDIEISGAVRLFYAVIVWPLLHFVEGVGIFLLHVLDSFFFIVALFV